MRIELLEGDELCQPDGKPKNIYISLEGRKMIIPTSKTILDLLELGKGITPAKEPIAPVIALETQKSAIVEDTAKPIPGVIEREDIVRCVKVIVEQLAGGAQPAARDIAVGGQYRVLSIHANDIADPSGSGEIHRVPTSYDVVDDSAPIKRRITVFPSEIELLRKHTAREKKVLVFEERMKCPVCEEDNVVLCADHRNDVHKNKYTGVCKKCGKELELELSTKAVSPAVA